MQKTLEIFAADLAATGLLPIAVSFGIHSIQALRGIDPSTRISMDP